VDHRSDDGYVAELRDGPELLIGSATRLRAKWAAAARVLADLEARGATYIDLRIPSRPAVGGLAATTVTPVAPAGTDLGVAPAGTEPSGIATGTPTGTEAGTVTPESAQTAVPDATATDPATTPTAPPTELPTTPVTPPTTGTEGGAAVAP
jgi:hypothetical protein